MFDRMLHRRHAQAETAWQQAVSASPIGYVRNSVRKPRMDGWERVTSEIILRNGLEDALDGIEGYSHVIVVTWMHEVPYEARTLTQIHPRGDQDRPLQGIFATRTQNRPNPIGVAVVPLLESAGAKLRVRGLDAIDGTPVLDVKPYVPTYDAVPWARVPEWTNAQGVEYWLGRMEEGRG